MGDHRANIKIEMEFHDVKDSVDMWINYSPNGCCNLDSRIIEFINSIYERGMEQYEDEMQKIYEEQHKKEIEESEKAELQRLKNKYEKSV